ncbi:hypothetical protein [Nocardia sp. NPDC058480]|uniref:hypothetical protein n=1 Tax=unclassified Nocardia TaxID=2637762 RepID=UPI003668C9A7
MALFKRKGHESDHAGTIVDLLTRQFAAAGIADPERVARKAADAGLAPSHIKTTATARFAVFRADSADQPKRFLADDLRVDARLIYFVVETPEGNWGRDIDGLYLENLLPWQRDIARATCDADIVRIPGIGDPSGGLITAAKGTMDNFVAELRCGSCGSGWWDGIRYRDFTAVRCPGCGTVNRVDSRNYTVETYTSPEAQEGSSASPPTEWAPLTPTQLAEPRQASERLVELTAAARARRRDLTVAQMQLWADRHHLDAMLSTAAPIEPWLAEHAEIRAIGRQLDRVGGLPLMRRTFDILEPTGPLFANVRVSYLWHNIGQWRD